MLKIRLTKGVIIPLLMKSRLGTIRILTKLSLSILVLTLVLALPSSANSSSLQMLTSDEAQKVKAIQDLSAMDMAQNLAVAPALPHMTDFLSAGCATHTFAGLSSSKRSSCLDNIESRGYTHFYLYAYNENDYGGPSFNFYNDPQGFRSRLQEVTSRGLAPVVWLAPDDAPAMRKKSTSQVQSMMDNLIPQIDDLVSSYVLGLELDEYWNQSKVDALGTHLNTLTNKPIGVHMLPGRWGYCHLNWCDYMVLQYGFGKSESFIKNMTKQAINSLGKPVVAGEYWSRKTGIDGGKHLGDAGVTAGASGFGNGGTAQSVPQNNQAPAVNAGANQTIKLLNSASLNGSVNDDGLPGGSVTISWSKANGPGNVTFVNASAENTSASFSDIGTYILRLTADDGNLSDSDDVTITVNSAPAPTPTSMPTSTPTPKPTPMPTSTPTPKPTRTPVPTSTPAPKPTTTPIAPSCPTLPGLSAHSQDLNSDGMCEDVNGNDHKDFDDIVEFFQYLGASPQQGMDELDFNGNDSLDMNDVVVLFNMLIASRPQS